MSKCSEDNQKLIQDLSKLDDPQGVSTLTFRSPEWRINKRYQEVILSERRNPNAYGLTPLEMSILQEYTYFFHKDINESLRGTKELTPVLKAVGSVLVDAIKKLPTYEGQVHRGIKENLLSNLEVGDVYSDPGFMSTNKLESGANLWDKNVELFITTSNGKDVSAVSKWSEESEVLIPPGVEFTITKIEGKKYTLVEKGVKPKITEVGSSETQVNVINSILELEDSWKKEFKVLVDKHFKDNDDTLLNKIWAAEDIFKAVLNRIKESQTGKNSIYGFVTSKDTNSTIQGLAVYKEVPELNALYIYDLTSSPSNIVSPGSGVGRKLINDLVEESISKGYKGKLVLEPIDEAIGFYEKLGFREVEIDGSTYLELPPKTDISNTKTGSIETLKQLELKTREALEANQVQTQKTGLDLIAEMEARLEEQKTRKKTKKTETQKKARESATIEYETFNKEQDCI